jgi:hypothetical protein
MESGGKAWMLRVAILLLLSAGSGRAMAQFKLSDVPLIKISDFQGPVPKKAKYGILIKSGISYKIDSVAREGDHYRVWIKTRVEMQRDQSYWNHKKVKPRYHEQLLLHEQGHFLVSHIVANRLEAHIARQLFSQNYEQEVRNSFSELHPKLYHQFSNYDKDTRHGMDEIRQREWAAWLRRQFK